MSFQAMTWAVEQELPAMQKIVLLMLANRTNPVLKELGGWSDLTMVLRYAHLSSEHLMNYANNATLKNRTNDKILSYPKKESGVKAA